MICVSVIEKLNVSSTFCLHILGMYGMDFNVNRGEPSKCHREFPHQRFPSRLTLKFNKGNPTRGTWFAAWGMYQMLRYKVIQDWHDHSHRKWSGWREYVWSHVFMKWFDKVSCVHVPGTSCRVLKSWMNYDLRCTPQRVGGQLIWWNALVSDRSNFWSTLFEIGKKHLPLDLPSWEVTYPLSLPKVLFQMIFLFLRWDTVSSLEGIPLHVKAVFVQLVK